MEQIAGDFRGGVFHDSLPNGRASASLVLRGSEVEATTPNGQRFVLPFRDTELSVGGASGHMTFCRSRDDSLTVFCDDKQFLKALESEGYAWFAEQIGDLRQADARRRRTHLLVALLIVVLLGGAAVGVWHAVRSVAVQTAGMLPVGVDEALGEATWSYMQKDGSATVVEDQRVVDAVRTIVDRLKPHADRDGHQFNYRVSVVQSDQINAVALPGGRIIVYTGLLEAAESPEQVAGVIAHEMAHVAKRHGVQSVAQAIGVQQLVSLALGDGSLLAAVGGDLMTGLARSSYSRDLEREADREGVKTLLAAGVDPQGLAEFFAIIEQRAGQPNVPEWASTHPDNAERIARIEQQLDEAPEQDFEPLLEDWENLRQHIRGNQPQ